MAEDRKVFLIINSYFIGDILLVNPMVQNIKRLYPDSIVVMVTSPKLVDIAKYQKGVDDVVIWDRKGKDKGFFGMIKFLMRLPYKKIYAAIPIYGGDRPKLLSLMTGAENILAPDGKSIIARIKKSKYPVSSCWDHSTQQKQIDMLTGIVKKEDLIDVAMEYNIPAIELKEEIKKELDTSYTVLCSTSTRKSKEMPLEVVEELVQKIGSKVVLVGSGKTAQEHGNALEKYSNAVNLANKTTILEAAKIIKEADKMISVDTGLMHFACALKTPVVCVFYEDFTKGYKPDSKLYNAIVVDENQNADNILSAYNNLAKIYTTVHQ